MGDKAGATDPLDLGFPSLSQFHPRNLYKKRSFCLHIRCCEDKMRQVDKMQVKGSAQTEVHSKHLGTVDIVTATFLVLLSCP